MGERPSHRPWLWGTRWPLVARWVKDRPNRVIAWYGGSLLVAIAILAIGVAASRPALIVGGGVASLIGVVEACIYVPRALRAMRRSN
jgi:hypothetical protein